MNSKFRGRGRGRGGHFYARSFVRTGPKPKLDQAAVVDTRFVVQRLPETSSSRGGDGQAGTTWVSDTNQKSKKVVRVRIEAMEFGTSRSLTIIEPSFHFLSLFIWFESESAYRREHDVI